MADSGSIVISDGALDTADEAALLVRKLKVHTGVSALWKRHEITIEIILLGVVSLLAWQFAATSGIVDPVLFPPPTKVAEGLGWLVGSGLLEKAFYLTFSEMVAAFILGCVLGISLGTLLATVRLVRLALYPYVIAFQSLPKVVLAPLFITWFGFGPESKIITALVICFFPVFLNTMVGLSLVEPDAVKLFRSLRASSWQTFIKLRFPNALPYIFAGLKTSLTFALTGAIAAEFLTGAAGGLGRLVLLFGLQIQVHLQLAIVLIVSVLGIAGVLVADIVDSRVVFWRKVQSDQSGL